MSSKLTSNLYFYSLLYIALSIPFQWKYLPFSVGITMLGLVWFLGGDLLQKIKKFTSNPYAILLSGLYLLYLISILYSENTSYGFTDLLLKLPLLLCPIFLSTTDKLNAAQYLAVLRTFAMSTFFAAIATLGIGYYNYLNTGLIKYFFYHDLTIFMHSAYYALYALFSITIFIYLFQKTQHKNSKILYSVMGFSLGFFLFLLSSRMQILIFILLLTVYILAIAFQKKRIIFGIIILGVTYACIVLLITTLPRTSARLNQTKNNLESISYSKTNSDARVQIWEAASKVIKKNYLFGTGVGDVKDKLVVQYGKLSENDTEKEKRIKEKIIEIQNNKKWLQHIKQKAKENNISVEDQLFMDAIFVLNAKQSRYKYFIKRDYNYHAQFLQTLSAVGFLGFLLLLFSMLIPAYNLGWKNKNYLLLAFMFMVFVSFITESMLERQAGLILFAFFSSFLILCKKEITDKSA